MILILAFSSCANSYKDYYYQLEDFEIPKYYVFKTTEDTTQVQYWKVSSDLKKKLLITEVFDKNFKSIEYFSEKHGSKGAELVEFNQIQDTTITRTTPIDKQVFLWNPKTSYKYSVNYEDQNGPTEFSKTRELIGLDSVTVFNEKFEALKMKGSYHIKYKKFNQTNFFWQYSFYTKDHGFVKYVRFFSDQTIRTLLVDSILCEDEWNSLMKSRPLQNP
ncbi:MAG: hypothetical protein ACI9J3_003010 [Parvicellaceae bacterium]|jgi:hypothetical protein